MTVPVSESNSSAGNFSENYWIDTASCIGKGKGMTVRVCYHRKTKLKYAVKSVQKKKVKAVEHLKNEIEMMRELSQHKKINTLMDFYEDEKQVYFVSELCTGGHLGNFIQTKVIDNSSIDYKKVEHEALTIIKQILDALAHCHEKNIVHRDLKLENILLKRARQLDIRLIDFDISTRHDDEIDEKMTKLVGTRPYMAPEVLNRQYTKSCDIWSLGVIAHALLCGELPFSGEDSEDLTDKIQNQDLLLISPAWDEISTEAKDFISGCLEKDTSKRSSLDELLTHDWIDSAFIQSKTVKLKGLKKIRAILEEKFQFQLKTLSKPEPSTAKESFRQ